MNEVYTDLAAKEKEIFPERLKELRSKRGTPPSVLAELCGLRRNSVSEYENSGALPRFESLVKLADHFGVSVDFLMGRDAGDPKTKGN